MWKPGPQGVAVEGTPACCNTRAGFPTVNEEPMSTNAALGQKSLGTTVETTEEDTCDECAKLSDGFPCADCYISGRKGFEGVTA